MLLAIRERATGIIAWIIVILLIIPFAFWGIQEYLGGGGRVIVAEVGGDEISWDQFTSAYESALRRRGERPTGEQALRVKRQVLQQLVDEALLVQAARDAGMRIGDRRVGAAIRSQPIFQTDGEFDDQLYKRLLLQNRLSEEAFVELQRLDMLRRDLSSGIVDTAFLTSSELNELLRLRNREIKLSYALIPVDRYRGEASVSDEEIAGYYEQHREQFTRPEQVKLAYLRLDPRDIESTIHVSEERLRERYSEQKSAFYTPEQRSAAHILISVEEQAGADAVEAARKQAEELYRRLEAGASFEALAGEHSDDPGSAEQGGELGVVARGTLDERFEEALFALDEVGEVSEPVRTSFGFHIIKLTDVEPPKQKSFAQVREELAAQIRRQEAEDLFYDRTQTLDELTYQNPTTLEPAADALGLEVQTSEWLDRSGSDSGIGAQREVIETAFSENVLAGGNLDEALNSQLIELQAEDQTRISPVVVVRVREHRPPRLQPLDAVRSGIAAQLREKRARQLTESRAEELLARLREGAQTLAALAEAEDLEHKSPGYVTRDSATNDPAVVSAAFELGASAEGQTRYTRVVLGSGDVALVAVADVRDGKPAQLPPEQRASIRGVLARVYGQDGFSALLEQLRREADITVHEKVLERGN